MLRRSCDTFVALPPATSDGSIVFGKNSDRPASEVQEVISFPAADHLPGSKLHCTYIDIPQVEHTYAVVLSRPSWIWGAEMGANEHGVVIGNEAVWTKFTGEEESRKESLIGMDYLRLGLERAKSAEEALKVITCLLANHGQGGRCFEDPDWANVVYCNSFLIADRTEAWVLETAGRNWAAERVKSGIRNISNVLSIGVHIDLMSEGLVDVACRNGWWNIDKDGPLDFTKAFSLDLEANDGRMMAGKTLLENLSKDGKFDVMSMFHVLRDTDSCICLTGPSSATVGSQVSRLPHDTHKPAIHWFTATPNPLASVFKPFTFTSSTLRHNSFHLTTSPDFGTNDPVRVKPRFMSSVDRSHQLYRKHSEVVHPLDSSNVNRSVVKQLMMLEKRMLTITETADLADKDMFGESVNEEMKIYSQHDQSTDIRHRL
jgi:secernin